MGLGAITVERGGVDGWVPIPFTLYALLVCLIVDLLLTKTFVRLKILCFNSYYLGQFIRIREGRLGSR